MKFQELIKQNKLFDSHCHLNTDVYDKDRAEVIANSQQAGVMPVIDVGIDEASSRKAVETALEYDNQIYAAVGVDPQFCIPCDESYIEDMDQLFSQFDVVSKLAHDNPEKVIMIGETGLDLYWMKVKNLDQKDIDKSLENQKALFEKHIELAAKLQLPLTIHTREAVDECIEILSGHNVTGVFHSLTPEADDNAESFEKKIRTILDMGFLISLNGIITYKSATLLRNTILKILKSAKFEERNAKSEMRAAQFYESGFIFETDGPYLAPEGKRGERNEPANVKDIFELLLKSI